MPTSQPRQTPPRKPRQAPRTRKPRAPQEPPRTRVTVTVLPPNARTARPPVDRNRYARSVRIAYLVILVLAVLFVLALAGKL